MAGVLSRRRHEHMDKTRQEQGPVFVALRSFHVRVVCVLGHSPPVAGHRQRTISNPRRLSVYNPLGNIKSGEGVSRTVTLIGRHRVRAVQYNPVIMHHWGQWTVCPNLNLASSPWPSPSPSPLRSDPSTVGLSSSSQVPFLLSTCILILPFRSYFINTLVLCATGFTRIAYGNSHILAPL
ncbi:hypothetical protein EI94DRAFT_837136 [Lactarius quietus]|nr:hypothetical protein EI94DRAFT_837136 [Lactarius quietus]